MRRRRLRHLGLRPRVHARDLQPDGRRAGLRAHRRARPARWARAGRTSTRSSTCTSTATCRPAARTSGRWAPYVTGNPDRGIRDYALDDNPLNFSDIGFDVTGPEVHADGEIWNAVNYDVRQAWCGSTTARFPRPTRPCSSAAPRASCLPTSCPGNRRWIQLVFDAFLLQQPATSMLDARDAYARRRRQPLRRRATRRRSGTRSPGAASAIGAHGLDRRRPAAAGLRLPACRRGDGDLRPARSKRRPPGTRRFFIGRFEARATPIADTDPARRRATTTVKLVPGTYDLIVQAPRLRRAPLHAPRSAGSPSTETFELAPNWASSDHGATATGARRRSENLIDDTEGDAVGGRPGCRRTSTWPGRR